MPKLAFTHLLCHAYFKALLFVTVGNMIHLADDFQAVRKASIAPNSVSTMALAGVANMALCGLPFLTGFFSKD